MIKKIMILMAAAALALVAGCATQPKAQTPAAPTAPVHHAEISTGYITLHTIPEGAMVLVNSIDASSFLQGKYVASGYTPLTFPVELADGLLSKVLMIRYTPTGPGQFTQTSYISRNQVPGDFTQSMYNTDPSAG
jgi:hypothetical protein